MSVAVAYYGQGSSAYPPERYPPGGRRGCAPYRTALDFALYHAGVRVDGWTASTDEGYALEDGRSVAVPPPVDAQSTIVGLHEVAHLIFRSRPAERWQREVDCWRAALSIYRYVGLPDVDEAERHAARSLATYRGRRHYSTGTLRRLLRGRVGAPAH